MTRKVLIGVLAVVAAGVAAAVIWFLAAGNVGDPTEVTAPPITSAAPTASVTTAASTASVTTAASTASVTTAASTASVTTAESSPQPSVVEESGETGATAASQTDPTDSPEVVELVLAEGTEARFLISEELRGEPFRVVGVTTEVVGRVRIDLSDLARSQMGEILINARAFVTDSSNRDRAIRGPILAAEQYEFITFSPSEITGLSGAAETEGEWSFSVMGELTVRDITRPVTFEVVARWGADDRLEGEASATVLRSDFELLIPSVPFVAKVADEIRLELDFATTPIGLG